MSLISSPVKSMIVEACPPTAFPGIITLISSPKIVLTSSSFKAGIWSALLAEGTNNGFLIIINN